MLLFSSACLICFINTFDLDLQNNTKNSFSIEIWMQEKGKYLTETIGQFWEIN